MQPEFRRVRSGDRGAIKWLIVEFHNEHGDPIDNETLERSVEAICAGHPLIPTWFVEVEGQAVGYVSLGIGYTIEVGGGDAFIDELYIRPFARGRGYGRAALQFVERVAPEHACRRLCLEVRYENTDAKRLYESLGYYGFDRELMFKDLDV